jgi:hypothetical protein
MKKYINFYTKDDNEAYLIGMLMAALTLLYMGNSILYVLVMVIAEFFIIYYVVKFGHALAAKFKSNPKANQIGNVVHGDMAGGDIHK